MALSQVTAHPYRAIAIDFDGTLASQGIVDARTLAALQGARETAIQVILVTGRTCTSLRRRFAQFDLFDRIVLENGAVVLDPRSGTEQLLAPPPPPALLTALEKKGVPFGIGRAIVATVQPYEHPALTIIRELGLEWHLVFNKGDVMLLPSNITKSTGLRVALDDLGVPPAQTAGIGDGENDHAFLQLCGLSCAVANAVPALKAAARVVTAEHNGAGVREFVQVVLGVNLSGNVR